MSAPAARRYLVTLTAEDGGAEFEYEVEGIFSPRVLAHFVWRKHHLDGGLPALIQPIAVVDLGPAAPGVPVDQWTDEEWLKVMETLPPDAPTREAEKMVYRWRTSDVGA